MSWEKFERLNARGQKEVLSDVFKRTGLRYSVNTRRGYESLKKEYQNYDAVRINVDLAIERFIGGD